MRYVNGAKFCRYRVKDILLKLNRNHGNVDMQWAWLKFMK